MGYNNAINGLAINTGYLHSQSDRWQIGYQEGWNAGKETINANQQSESSSVNIHGDQNKVNIEQGQLSNQEDGADNGGGSDHAPNSRCELICVSLSVC